MDWLFVTVALAITDNWRSIKANTLRFLFLWWYATFGWTFVTIFGAALLLGADETDAVGSLKDLLGLYLVLTALIETVRAQNNLPGRLRAAFIGLAGIAVAYLGFVSTLDTTPARWEPALLFFGYTVVLGFLGLATAWGIWMARPGKSGP